MIQIAFFATIPVERMKGPLKKSLVNRMYTIDRTGGGMDADDFQKLRNRAVKFFSLYFYKRNKSSSTERSWKYPTNQPPRHLTMSHEKHTPITISAAD